MKIIRKWAMSNKNTFTIDPIKKLIRMYMTSGVWLDPFANDNTIKEIGYQNVITNDLNNSYDTDYHLDANTFLEKFNDVDGVLFDPPYTPRQLKEMYDGIGQSLTSKDTQLHTWKSWRESIANCIKPRGICISFGYNSNGIGMKRGFKIEFILLIAHGSNINDTICTVERKDDVPVEMGVLR